MTSTTFLHGERIALRPVEREDAPFLQRAHNEPELRVPVGYSQPTNEAQVESEIEERVESDDSINLVVALDDEPIGYVGVNNLQWTAPFLAAWFLPEYQREGYGREAVSLLLDYFFETFEKPGVHAHAFDFNEASMGLLESIGFTQEGRFRKNRFIGGRYVDAVHYGLLREEWGEKGEEGAIERSVEA